MKTVPKVGPRGTSYPQGTKHAPIVYFIQQMTGARKVKIGTTTNLTSRFARIKTSSPEKLKVQHTEPGGTEREDELHRRFAKHHYRREWFNPDPEILAYIRRPDARSPVRIRRQFSMPSLRPLVWLPLGVWALVKGLLLARVSRRYRRRRAVTDAWLAVGTVTAAWTVTAWYFGATAALTTAIVCAVGALLILGRKADR